MPGTEPASIAELLKHYRAAAGLTQEELAERATLSARAISDLERGINHRPQAHTVGGLIEALGLEGEQAACFLRAARQVNATAPHDLGKVAALLPPAATECGTPCENLPLQPTGFIGRQQEMREVSALLLREDVRLLTLTGPGGVGKTRLALQVADEVQDAFPDGVCFVSLASLLDPELVPSVMATALGVKEVSGQPLLATLTSHFQSKRRLLVLDNFEHLLPAADVLSLLLASCPQLTILVTSRAMLHLAAEHEYPVPPLIVPTPHHLPDLDGLSRYDAVLLFVYRAQAVKPDFHLSEQNAAAIAETCWRLDGLPLAIELAAARIRVLPLQGLLVRLANRMQVLIGGPRDVPTRQQTLRNTIDWSYSLLPQERRSLFARLSVFAGGCTVEAAEAVCNTEGDPDILDGITSLVDTSLLRRAGDEEERFSMLETIREYAVERLEESGHEDAIREAHAAHFYRMVEDIEPKLVGPKQGMWMRHLDREIDNIRAALTWHLEHGRVDAMLQMTGNLWRYWDSRALFDEARRWLSAGLTATGGEDPSGRVYQHLGHFVWRLGKPEEAKRLLERDLERAQHQGDDMTVAAIWSTLGLLAAELGDYDDARRLHEASVALRRSLGDGRFVAHSLSCLGTLLLEQHRYEEAQGHLVEAINLSRIAGDAWFLGIELGHLGFALLGQGDDSRAWQLFHESLGTLHELGEQTAIIEPLRGAMAVASIRGQPIRAARLAGALDGLGSSLGRAEPHLATARSSLDPQTWNKEWERGRAMGLDEAISFALEEDE